MPLSKEIEAVIHAKETFRKDRDWNNHHTVLAEGAPAVGWVAVVRIRHSRGFKALVDVLCRHPSRARMSRM